MADFNKLKDTIRGAIYPNGRGAISADKHQAALLDMADTMQETDTKLTELSERTSELVKETSSSNSSEIVITDDDDNVVATIGEDGADFKNLKSDGEKVITKKNFPVDSVEVNNVDEGNEIIITDDNDNVVGKINEEGADFKNLRSNGNKVLTEGAIPSDAFDSGVSLNDDDILFADEEDNIVGRLNESGANFKDLRSNGSLVNTIENAISTDEDLRADIAPLCDLKISENGQKQTLKLKDANGGRYLLALHRKANDGTYKVQNDVFLPSARKDFADVRIYTNEGETLPQRVLFKGNFDVLKIEHQDKLNGRIHTYNGKYYCGGWNNGIFSSSDGITWSRMDAISEGLQNDNPICLLTSTGTMFFGSKGVLYKSEYPYTTKKAVLNENDIYANSAINASSMAEDDKGYLYIGHYQLEYDIIVKRSKDNGETWQEVYRDSSGKYQHVHAITFDSYNKTLYVGLDGGGGILYSKDNGDTFVDLRDKVADIPQSTDYGVIYAEDGCRFLGGETSIVGGSSIIKTEDDKTFRSVLNTGKACYYIRRIGNCLVATLNSSENFNSSQIVYSEDNGESWKLLYASACHDEGGPSDGFRDMTALVVDGKEKLYVISRGASFSDLIIEQGAENYYAEVLVDVPQGIDEIHIESGYAMRCAKRIVNDITMPHSIFYAPLTSDDGRYMIDGRWQTGHSLNKLAEGGRTMADIYPAIRSANDMQSVVIGAKPYYEGNLNLPSQFHIGFWMRSRQQKDAPLSIVKSNDLHIEVRDGYKLFINGSSFYNFNVPMVDGNYIRVDINIQRGGFVDMYVNGVPMARTNKVCPNYTMNATYSFLSCLGGFVLQHFAISESHVTQTMAQGLYDGMLNDNI